MSRQVEPGRGFQQALWIWKSGGPCEVGSMAESSKGGSIGLEGHLAETLRGLQPYL